VVNDPKLIRHLLRVWDLLLGENTGGNCVEVADNLADRVLVRDPKDRPGPVLTFGPVAWTAFVTDVSRVRP
jgi:hypothetical protein